MLKRHFFLIAAGVGLGLMVLAIILKLVWPAGSSSTGPSGGGRGQLVSETVVGERGFSDQIRVLGVARGRRSVNITPNNTELITRIMFTDGQSVAAGTPLVELQAREEDANLIQARAELLQAQREYDRFKDLAERGFAPRVTAENAETALQSARALVAAAEARRGDRIIRAPFAGVIGLTTITPGTLVSPGAVIATLDDISVLRVDFPVPERYLSTLRAGTPITAVADAFPGEVLSGRIALLDTRIDEATRAIIARAEFPNPGGRVRPGMLVRVAVQQGDRRSIAVPEAAIQYEGQGAFIYRIAPNGEGSNAQRVEVETGVVENGFVEILSGLRAGEKIIASGLNRIQPGAAVQVAAPAAAENAAGAPTTGTAAQ